MPSGAFLSGAHLDLIELEALDLRPDRCSVAGVEGEQIGGKWISGSRAIFRDQLSGKAATAVVGQVHCQEGYLTRDVAVAKAIVELDAVEDQDVVSQADAGGVNIPMTVAELMILVTVADRVASG